MNSQRVRNHSYPATLYSVFDLPPGSTSEALHERYRELCAEWHPDREPGNEERFSTLTAAWARIKTSQGRKQYDAELRILPGQCPICDGTGQLLKSVGGGWSGVAAPQAVECAQCEGTGMKPLSEKRAISGVAKAGKPR